MTVSPEEPIDLTAPPKSANATEAPTSGKTLGVHDIAKLAQTGLTEAEFDFVNIMHSHYRKFGTLCTAAVGLDMYNILESKFKELLKRDRVQSALVARGIPLDKDYDEDNKWRNHALSAEQLFVADVMLDLNDTRSFKKKLQDLKVSTSRWDAWTREPAFGAYLDANTSQILKNGQHEAALSLMDKVKMGDLAAIKFYMEYTNRFVPKQSATGGSEQNDLFNARQLINDLVEIIIDEVDDHETAARISDRLKGLMQKSVIVQGLTNPEQPEVIVPTTVPTRELTQTQKDVGTST